MRCRRATRHLVAYMVAASVLALLWTFTGFLFSKETDLANEVAVQPNEEAVLPNGKAILLKQETVLPNEEVVQSNEEAVSISELESNTPRARTGPVNFIGFDNEKGAPGGELIVPNIVHYVRFDQPEFNFIDFVCILSALQRQRPERMLFHTNLSNFTGRYWNKLLARPGFTGVAQIAHRERLKEIFGQPFDDGWGRFHGTDVARMQILMEYGGIFLDSDSYVAQSMDPLRKYEFSLGWPQGQPMGTQVLIGHRDARFPREYLETYRGAYDGKRWYYNAGERPTAVLLKKKPHLFHREEKRIWVDWNHVCDLFARNWTTWRTDTIVLHLFQHHNEACMKEGAALGYTYPVEYSEENMLQYRVTILDMVLDVYPELQAPA